MHDWYFVCMWWSSFDLPQLVWSSGWSAIGLAWSINHWWLGSDGFRPLLHCVWVGLSSWGIENGKVCKIDWQTMGGVCVCLWVSICGNQCHVEQKLWGFETTGPLEGNFTSLLDPTVFITECQRNAGRGVTKPWLCVNSYYRSIVSLMSAQGKFR